MSDNHNQKLVLNDLNDNLQEEILKINRLKSVLKASIHSEPFISQEDIINLLNSTYYDYIEPISYNIDKLNEEYQKLENNSKQT